MLFIHIYIGKDVKIDAYAKCSGNGGKVIVWSDDNTHFYGTINARAGRESGNGGFVEISSHKNLDYRGNVFTDAPSGRTGTILFDPLDLVINAVGSTNVANLAPPFTENYPIATPANLDTNDLQTSLIANNVIIRTSGSAGPESGHLIVSAPISWPSNNMLTLSTNVSGVTNGEIRVLQSITCTGAGGLILDSGSDTYIARNITLATGNALVQAPNGNITIASGNTSFGITTGGNVEISNVGGDLLIRGAQLAFFAAVPCTISGNIVMIKDIDGNVTIEGGGGAIIFPGTVDINSTTQKEVSNIGGDLIVEGGYQFGAFSRLRSSANMNIKNVRGGIYLQGGVFPNCDALINSGGVMNITGIGGDIVFNPTPSLRGAEIFADGNMIIQTEGSFIFNEHGIVQIDNPAPGIDLTLFAGRDFSTGSIPIASSIIWNRSTTGQITIAVDNNNPTFPGLGTGAFLLGPNADIRPGSPLAPIRIFTSMRESNSVEGTMRGLPFIPGEKFVNSATEEWGVYYPGGFSGDPFTIFYKEGTALFDLVKDIVFIASAEMLSRELHSYDEYVSRYLDFDIRYQKDKDTEQKENTTSSYDILNKIYYFIRQKENPIRYIQPQKSL